MNKIIFAVFMTGSLAAFSFNRDYKHVFSSDIYDQGSLNEFSSDEEKLKLLYSKQIQALTTKVLSNLDQSILHNSINSLKFDDMKLNLLLLLPAYAAGPSAMVIAILLGDYYNSKLQAQIVELESNSELLEYRKRVILGGIRGLPHSKLERAYVQKKNTVNEERQKIIERHLILAYDSAINGVQMDFLDAAIFFPNTIRCLSINGDIATFRKGLADAKVRLADDLKRLNVSEDHAFICQQVLIGIAKAAMDNFQKRTQTQEAYYLRTNEDIKHYAQQIAYVLDRSFFVVDASTKPQLDDEYCFGVKQTKRGLFLEPFLAGDKERRIKNPLLIILNADRWFINEENFKFILKLLDKSSTTFYSAYLEMDIDWSSLCVVCFGSTNSTEFIKALQSRLHSYDLTKALL